MLARVATQMYTKWFGRMSPGLFSPALFLTHYFKPLRLSLKEKPQKILREVPAVLGYSPYLPLFGGIHGSPPAVKDVPRIAGLAPVRNIDPKSTRQGPVETISSSTGTLIQHDTPKGVLHKKGFLHIFGGLCANLAFL